MYQPVKVKGLYGRSQVKMRPFCDKCGKQVKVLFVPDMRKGTQLCEECLQAYKNDITAKTAE
jgi:hypothetical protein